MSKQIIQIDLNKLDQDIAEAENRLAILLNTKKYAQSIAISEPEKPVEKTIKLLPSPKAETKSKETTAKKSKTKTTAKKTTQLRVSDFILKYLKGNDKIDTKSINKAYAIYTGKNESEIEISVSNGLSKLKRDNLVSNERRTDGTRGMQWFLTKRL